MYFSSSVLAVLLPALALSAPVEQRGDECPAPPRTVTTTTVVPTSTTTSSSSGTPTPTQTPPFTAVAVHSGSSIQYASLDARDLGIYLNAGTLSYCPSAEVPDCPAGTYTSFVVGTTGNAAMNVEVPGGQQLYVGPNGALGYTEAHSATIPSGSLLGPFFHTEDYAGSLGEFGFTGLGFLACPKTSAGGNYQVFVAIPGLSNSDVPSGNVNDCIGMDVITTDQPANSIGAWEYT